MAKYRWRTWLRKREPNWLYERWPIPKGSTDCGDHEFYLATDGLDRCDHCTAGMRASRFVMRQMTIGPWVVEVDPKATADLSERTTPWTDECGCDHCKDWAAHREEIYSAPVRDLLASLGIDYLRETDVSDYASEPECRGEFYFVGRIVSGPGWTITHRDFFGQVSQGPEETPITDDFSLIVSDRHGGAGEPMATDLDAGVPLVQVQFTTTRHRHRIAAD